MINSKLFILFEKSFLTNIKYCNINFILPNLLLFKKINYNKFFI